MTPGLLNDWPRGKSSELLAHVVFDESPILDAGQVKTIGGFDKCFLIGNCDDY